MHGVAALLVAVAVIGVRGYLIPGTPTLIARYLPEPDHRALGHEPSVDERSPRSLSRRVA